MEITIVITLIVAAYLAFQRWFWILAGWLGGIASVFAMLASIISFQILGAMGFLILAGICFFVASIAAE
jgi:hypothetical protein